MIGRELAELIIPPDLRDAHRRGVERYVATGRGAMLGHPVELPGMRADGTEFPVEIAVTRPELCRGRRCSPASCATSRRASRDEEVLRALADEQAALRRVATVVASAEEPAHVFEVVTEEVGRLLGAQTSNMLRFEPGGGAVVLGGWSTGDVRNVPVGTRVALDGPTVAARIRDTGAPERVDDYSTTPGTTADLLRDLGFRSSVGTPTMLGGRLWGAVLVSTVRGDAVPGGRRAAHRRLRRAGRARARQRRGAAGAGRLARPHRGRPATRRAGDSSATLDGAQQRLVALSLDLRLAERRLAAGDPAAGELLQRATEDLASALEELRQLARGIHPAILSDKGIVPALEMLAGRATIPVELCAALDDRLPPPVEAAAYYLVAEALTNAAKHAGASSVNVQVTRGNGRAVVEVADDGVGGVDQRRGSGLRGLRDRVEALGGTLEISSPSGVGTTLTARLPCGYVASWSSAPPATSARTSCRGWCARAGRSSPSAAASAIRTGRRRSGAPSSGWRSTARPRRRAARSARGSRRSAPTRSST